MLLALQLLCGCNNLNNSLMPENSDVSAAETTLWMHVQITPMISTAPKIMNINPESLLIMPIFLSVNFFRSRPARFIFKKSADMLSKRQIEKIVTLSSKVFDSDFVAAANQSAITPGFNVLIKKPVIKRRACVALPIFTPLSSSSLLWYFLKNK